MKAIVISEFGEADVLKVVDVDIPSINKNQVLIRVDTTCINFADIQTRQGKFHAAGKPPIIPGLDAAGIIEAIGSDVKSLKVGQRVIAFPHTGSYAEYVVADEQLTFLIPDSIDFQVAAASPIVSFTAYMLLANVARIQPGETVLIHAAAGGIGTTAIQLAKILGAGCVIGTVGSEKKASVVLEMGADHVICNDKENFVEKVHELTGGQGADVILDSIAGKVTEMSLASLAYYGRLVNFGNASGESGQVVTKDLHASCRAVLGFSLSTTKNKRPELLRETAERVIGYLADGRLDIKIGDRFKMEDVVAAHRLVESRQSIGKVLLEMNK